MTKSPVAILSSGLVTSLGLSAAATCAALRAGATNPSQSELIEVGPEPLVVNRVPLPLPWKGLARLTRLAELAASEALTALPHDRWEHVDLLLCVAESERHGRVEDLDVRLASALVQSLEIKFVSMCTIPRGKVGIAVALDSARLMLEQKPSRHVLVVAVDSLLSAATLADFLARDRLLTEDNSNGFVPGEGAGALLLSAPSGVTQTLCEGIGFGKEAVNIDSTLPFRGDGLAMAMRGALADAQCPLHEIAYRITDIAGEQYQFKEDNLALVRLLRGHKSEFDMWHPAEGTGETGAATGAVMLAQADAAARGGYAPGPRVLLHMGSDTGERAALVLRYGIA